MEPAFLAVARIRKPHGLKGEAVVWLLTDDPEGTLAPGKQLTPVDASGRAVGPPLTIERSRRYHRQWLLKFHEVADRTAFEQWDDMLLGARREELREPVENEAYVHELPGMEVVVGGRPIGRVTDLIEVPAGQLLAVDVEGREVLVPFRHTIIRRVDREQRRIEMEPPPGLLEL